MLHMKRRSRVVYFLIGGCIAAAIGCYAWFPIPLAPSTFADRVIVLKGQRRILLLRDGQEICSYRISLGRNPHGPKERQGDHKTPEGLYILDHKNKKSGYHLAMHLSYPNASDRLRSAVQGVSPGGDIMVHGIKNGLGWIGRFQRLFNWTDGCIALTNPEMDQFSHLVPEGTPVEIRP
jgi:murein L,D-transpeptidase YafK